jgi:putative heme-binding domain-containing protein
VPVLLPAARDHSFSDAVRAEAVLGLSERSQDLLGDLLALARDGDPALSDEALRALVNTKLDAAQRSALEAMARHRPEAAPLVDRVLGKPFAKDRPPATDADAWLKRLDGPADAAAGRRVFFHPKLAGCFRCHRAEGRGREVGPDLSTVGRNERRQVVESVLQPSALVAPHYQVWQIETADGKVRTGMLMNTELDVYTYADTKGDFFKVNTRDVADLQPLPKSIMPDGLADLLTDQELRDLFAYLWSRR